MAGATSSPSAAGLTVPSEHGCQFAGNFANVETDDDDRQHPEDHVSVGVAFLGGLGGYEQPSD